MTKTLNPLTRLFSKEDPQEDYIHIFGVARKKKKLILVILRQYLQLGTLEFQKKPKVFDTVHELAEWVNKVDSLARAGISDHGNALGTAVLGLRRYLNDSSLSEPCLTASIELGKKEKGVPIQTNLLSKFDAYLTAGALTLPPAIKKVTPSYSLDMDDKHNMVPYYVQDFDPMFNAALCCLHDFPFKPEDFHSPAVRENAFKGYLFRQNNKVETESGSIEWLGKFHDSIGKDKKKLSKSAKIAKAMGPDAEWNRAMALERSKNPVKAAALERLADLFEKHSPAWVSDNLSKWFTKEEIELIT
ncbi:MAG: hypothetical protein KAV87_52995 [Desulfobacteraceae bacterium]|nr:hypothetical protein [Desulfobacteraceae bacterium]